MPGGAKAEALQQVTQKVEPTAILLISSSSEGKEVAARLAVKLNRADHRRR